MRGKFYIGTHQQPSVLIKKCTVAVMAGGGGGALTKYFNLRHYAQLWWIQGAKYNLRGGDQ